MRSFVWIKIAAFECLWKRKLINYLGEQYASIISCPKSTYLVNDGEDTCSPKKKQSCSTS